MSNKDDYNAWTGFLMFFLWGIVAVGFLGFGGMAVYYWWIGR